MSIQYNLESLQDLINGEKSFRSGKGKEILSTEHEGSALEKELDIAPETYGNIRENKFLKPFLLGKSWDALHLDRFLQSSKNSQPSQRNKKPFALSASPSIQPSVKGRYKSNFSYASRFYDGSLMEFTTLPKFYGRVSPLVVEEESGKKDALNEFLSDYYTLKGRKHKVEDHLAESLIVYNGKPVLPSISKAQMHKKKEMEGIMSKEKNERLERIKRNRILNSEYHSGIPGVKAYSSQIFMKELPRENPTTKSVLFKEQKEEKDLDIKWHYPQWKRKNHESRSIPKETVFTLHEHINKSKSFFNNKSKRNFDILNFSSK